mmetsp:Transcript_79120/g.229820  ORF Transcript_79120/g.229820 Transcript_79120/m.229820 type:complete len:246 (-) Transcript_79120:2196-2933(-)
MGRTSKPSTGTPATPRPPRPPPSEGTSASTSRDSRLQRLRSCPQRPHCCKRPAAPASSFGQGDRQSLGLGQSRCGRSPLRRPRPPPPPRSTTRTAAASESANPTLPESHPASPPCRWLSHHSASKPTSCSATHGPLPAALPRELSAKPRPLRSPPAGAAPIDRHGQCASLCEPSPPTRWRCERPTATCSPRPTTASSRAAPMSPCQRDAPRLGAGARSSPSRRRSCRQARPRFPRGRRSRRCRSR